MAKDEILLIIGVWISEGSGWALDKIDSHHVNINRYNPLIGSSYMELPKELQHPRQGLINIQNIDDECFRWCHLASKFPVNKDPNRVTKYMGHMNELNYSNIKFPVKQAQYNRIETQNSINVNVFGYENGQPYHTLFTFLRSATKIV